MTKKINESLGMKASYGMAFSSKDIDKQIAKGLNKTRWFFIVSVILIALFLVS